MPALPKTYSFMNKQVVGLREGLLTVLTAKRVGLTDADGERQLILSQVEGQRWSHPFFQSRWSGRTWARIRTTPFRFVLCRPAQSSLWRKTKEKKRFIWVSLQKCCCCFLSSQTVRDRDWDWDRETNTERALGGSGWSEPKKVKYLASQQHSKYTTGTDLLRSSTCCHTGVEAAYQTCLLTQSQYTDTGPAIPSTDPSHSPLTPGQPFQALTLSYQALGRGPTTVPIFKSVVWLHKHHS